MASLFLAGIMAVSFAACGGTGSSSAASAASASAADSTASAADNTFTVGFDQNFPPMGFKGSDGKFTGFDLDLAAEAAKRMGMAIKYQPISWDAKDAELTSGTIDCIWNGFTISGRENNYTWSKPYMENDQVFVVKADSAVKSLADLKGKTVEVQTDSAAQAALKEKTNISSAFANVQTTADYNTALMDLDMGAVDAVAMDSTVADYKITSGKLKLKILGESIQKEQYGIGFKKGNTALCAKVSKAMDEMKKDGTLTKISKKWFGKDVTTWGKA
ncbi:transporter substrate-binding domain-containing protein [Caproicibacterium lactatifermentans]|uniref:Transporter substrate-binding domain-containing protein n=1 Tax=Caproicibacterium lactatifermentans TaxID=2666138 RepID=A0A859DRH7_9FIRM|nr:transporter substrate-binding domain-containing protein [Caproicibacterium lactatifermentans]QKO31144.1 transporter substrate-binding domain-containing protein [Caproicibacterium lactatifermentans]